MKKLTSLFLLVCAISVQSSFAAQAENEVLVPATSLEEMMNEEVSHFDGHHGGHEFNHDIVCVAGNRRGQKFYARGRYAREAQERALRECQQSSHRCFELGCRRH
jgi:hypothetical protein